MQDRLKIRIWDKKNNVMLHPEEIKKLIFDFDEKAVRILLKFHPTWIEIPFDECIILHCTGLKDKNGELIFAGDILDHYAFIDVVVFKNGIFTTKNNAHFQPLYIHGLSELKIIGNIYENPELLEAQ